MCHGRTPPYDVFLTPPGRNGRRCGPGQPFEDNPEFRRHRPLSDATKEKIFQAIISNPTENPPRKVAAKFGISLERLDAIVRLKKLEREMVENVRARGARERHPDTAVP